MMNHKWLTLPRKQEREIRIIAEALSQVKGVDKVILFGSFARWDYVLQDFSEDNGSPRVYESDYDILVILKHYSAKRERLADKTLSESMKLNGIQRGVDLIVEGIFSINRMLEKNNYFYADIIREWIILFDGGHTTFSEAKQLSKSEIKALKTKLYRKWFKKGSGFFDIVKYCLSIGHYNEAAFLLHQTTEAYMTCYLLVKTGYRPKTHDLAKLYGFLGAADKRFSDWFNLHDLVEKDRFELLKKAYVDARYNDDYAVSQQELTFLITKVDWLKEQVERLCLTEI